MTFVLALFLLILNFHQSYGINEFTTNQDISYQFTSEGVAKVEHKVNIINNFSQFYPKEYKLSISGSSATNIQAYDENGDIPLNLTQDNNQVNLSLIPSNPKTGKDQITTINIRYQSASLALKKGKTWEINIPQFEDKLSNNTNIILNIPGSFGKLSSSPPKAIIAHDSQVTTISFNNYNQQNKLVLTFGEFQLFNFDLKYYIQNTTDQNSLYTIPLPPDTSNQKIYFSNISPKPIKIENDIDGNWLAFYELPPHTSIDVNAMGQAKIGNNPNYQFISPPNFAGQLYWPVDNPQILNLSKTIKTPRQIYDFVVSTLNYDFNRVNNSNRQGALFALENPNNSLCTDFTDLFVTLARASNIGAREIEGYAFSNNTEIKPISVGTDILHAWPEYFNATSKQWIAIDPTWAKTTGGINYFDNLDLNHFALVIHNNKSDSPPPPGSFKKDPNQKSIDISFAETEINTETKKLTVTPNFKPFGQSNLTFYNPNNFALDNFIINEQNPVNILPISSIKTDYPKINFFESLLPKNQNIQVSYSYNNLPNETVSIQNPYHFFNLFICIISSLILLSFGAIILLHKK